MAVRAYPKGKYHIAYGDQPLRPNTYVHKAMIVGAGAAFDPNHEWVSDIIAYDLSPGGFAGHISLASRTLTVVGDNVVFKSNSCTFVAVPLGGQIQAVVIYVAGGTTGSSALLSWYDGGSSPNDLPHDTTGGDFIANPHPVDGWLKL